MKEIKGMKSHKAVIAGIFSAIIWGGGQFLNGQFIKAAFFLMSQIAFLFALPKIIPSIQGIITLGDTAMKIQGSKVIHGDNSMLLLIFGLVWIFIALIFAIIYILNLNDAVKTARLYEQGKKVLKGKEWLKHLSDHAFPYLVLTPTIILVVMFVAVPIIFGFLIAFTNYSTPDHLPPKNLVDWVGFQNFIDMFKLPMWNDTLLGVAGWTLIWATISTFSCFFGGLFMAVLVNAKRVKFKKLWRTIYILPWAIPGMISLLVFRNLFNGQFGAINTFLRNVGIIQGNIPWLSNPLLAKIVIFVVNFWLGFPYFMAMMSGVMTSISNDVVEAARIDGADSKQEFRYITFPLVLYTTAPLLIMSFAGNFNNFNVIFFLTDGGPANPVYKFAGSTDIFITWIFKLTLTNRQYGMASVMSIMVFLVVASISTYNFLRTRAFKEEDMMN